MSSVIPIIPFIGVRISCDILARNSDLLLLANSAASLAAVFFWIASLKLNTMLFICVFRESISPDASTVMKRVKSPSIAAAEICAKPRTCVVRFPAMVFTDSLECMTDFRRIHIDR